MEALSSYLRKRGLKDGLIQGRKPWAIVGIVVWTARLLTRLGTRRPQVVARERLEPGQSISITSIERGSGSSSRK